MTDRSPGQDSDPSAELHTENTPDTGPPHTITLHVDAGGWGIALAIDEDGRFRQIAVGPQAAEAHALLDPHWYPEAHPTWGDSDPLHPPALRITHHDGTLTTRLRAADTPASEEPMPDGGIHHRIQLVDELFDLAVTHHLRTHPASGVLEQWVEIRHDEPGPVRLCDYDSIAPLILLDEAAEITQFGGSGWADEWRWTTQRLHPGVLCLASLGTVQPHLKRSPCLLVSPNGPSEEDHGDVIGLSIAWGGNTRFELDLNPAADPASPSKLRLRAGANPFGAQYVLEPGEAFATPVVAWTWSNMGRAEITRRFHDWTRARVLRDPQRLRPLVANNWEATSFDFDEARVIALIDRAADLGADLFLLDDGWFGTTHPRDDDTVGLGDWTPDPAKLPGGLAPLAEAAENRGIRFGIWVEPEMVNPRSELYEQHPDWVLRDRREPRLHRNQLVLDPLRPEVRSFEVGVLDRTLEASPAITYVKWDANRPLTEVGSAALPPDRQENLGVDLVRATWEVMDTVMAHHPDTEMMLCASGGGRTDHGTLSRFHEFWTSDNTDPVTRVRMQWACSHFFPPAAMAAHVTRWGDRPLQFACAVALSGRFGFDLDLEALTADELMICRAAVRAARRTQPLVQLGRLQRLVSPVEGSDRSRAAVAHTAEDCSRAVVFAYQLDAPAEPAPPVRPRLRKGWTFRVTRTDLTADPEPVGEITAEQLADEGFDWSLEQPQTACIWELEAITS